MKEFSITIQPNIDEKLNQITNEYWLMNELEFINKPTELTEKYGFTLAELNKVIKEHTSCKIIHGICSDCNTSIEDTVFSQSRFKEVIRNKYRSSKICDTCNEKRLREYQEKTKQEKLKEKAKMFFEFSEAIREERWKNLDDYELYILKGIVKHKTKSNIYQEIFKDNPYDHKIWAKIKKIQQTYLLFIERDDKTVVAFHYPKELETIFAEKKEVGIAEDQIKTNAEQDIFRLTLFKNSKKLSDRHPDYSGSFISKKTITFEVNKKYDYAVWVNPEGYLSLQIKPFDKNYHNNEQLEFEREPEHIKTVLERLVKQLNSESKEE